MSTEEKSMSIIVTKGSLDWAYPPFILATTAAAMGLPVTMFFHELDRLPCGAPTRCENTVCEAAVAAGAGEEVCGANANQRARKSKQPGTGVGATGSAHNSPPPKPAPSPS